MFGEPDADWTDEYEWTRYRGPQPYPVPEDWVLKIVEADGVSWWRYPEVGEGKESDKEMWDEVDGDVEEYRAERAYLVNEPAEPDRLHIDAIEQKLTIGGETIFERIDPEEEELWKKVAEALARVSQGDSVEEIAEDVSFVSGSAVDDEERQKEENRALGEFGGDAP